MKHIFEIKMLFSFNIQIPKHYFFKMYFVAWKYISSHTVYIYSNMFLFLYIFKW